MTLHLCGCEGLLFAFVKCCIFQGQKNDSLWIEIDAYKESVHQLVGVGEGGCISFLVQYFQYKLKLNSKHSFLIFESEVVL